MSNRIRKGWIWEAVEDHPQHFYEILNDDEVISLRRLVDKKTVTRYRGQVTEYGITRERRKSDR